MEDNYSPNKDSAVQDSPSEPQTTPAPGTETKQPSKTRKLNIFAGKEKYELAVLLLIIIVVAAVAFYFGKHATKADHANVVKTAKPAAASQNTVSSTTPKLPDAEFLSGTTYLDSPQKLGDLGFLSNYNVFGCDSNCASDFNINYYQIGATAAGQKIVVLTYTDGPGGESYVFAIEQSNGTYSVLAQNSYDAANFATYWLPSLSSKVTIDDKTKLDDIKMPLQLTVANQKMKSIFASEGAPSFDMNSMSLMTDGLASIRGGFYGDVAASAIKKLGSQDNIDFYEVTASDTDNYKVIEYHGAYKQLFSSEYDPNGEISSATGALNINWSAGTDNKSSYFSSGQGCGSNGYVVAKNVTAADLTRVGTTAGGQAVYQLPQSNALVQEIYNKDYVDDTSSKNLSLDQFTKQHGYFLAKNGLGEYVLFLRDDMIIHGGCAKPVIYLYPQQKQKVSVKVGAKVVNSDPLYGSGWNNITAYPDGSLSYDGKTYGSLFWDGYGYGSYPDIDAGVIVNTSQAADTVKAQLKQQGLNSQEISDFLNYWQPKLASVKQPYIRLTWLNTSEMNNLAPLQISPQPQTLIRVFLDFEGINQPYRLEPQHLNALPRNGFTVVEWGGLARQGLN